MLTTPADVPRGIRIIFHACHVPSLRATLHHKGHVARELFFGGKMDLFVLNYRRVGLCRKRGWVTDAHLNSHIEEDLDELSAEIGAALARIHGAPAVAEGGEAKAADAEAGAAAPATTGPYKREKTILRAKSFTKGTITDKYLAEISVS